MDPWHFGTDPDLWIRTTDSGLRILLFCQWLTRCQKIYFFKKFFAYYFLFLKVHLYQSSKIKSHKIGDIKVFHTFFACWRKDPDQYNYWRGILRIRIRTHSKDNTNRNQVLSLLVGIHATFTCLIPLIYFWGDWLGGGGGLNNNFKKKHFLEQQKIKQK